jgi:hypothetical protein
MPSRASRSAPNPVAPQLPEHEVAQRAYTRWLARGCPTSDGREDWFAAEAELRAELTPASAPRRPIRSALRRLGL